MSRIVKLSTSMAALLVGLSVANAQMEEPRQGQGGQGGAQTEQRQEQGGQQGSQERRGGQESGGAEKREGSGERAQGKEADEGKNEPRKRTGQGEEQGETRKDRSAEGETKERKGESTERNAQGKDGKSGEQRSSREGGERKKGVKNVNITQEKKTVIRERVITKAPKRYKRNEINFNISVGTSVPSDFVIYDLPPTFIEIVPEYQGYDYIVVGDVLLVIDPDTREIVDVVQV